MKENTLFMKFINDKKFRENFTLTNSIDCTTHNSIIIHTNCNLNILASKGSNINFKFSEESEGKVYRCVENDKLILLVISSTSVNCNISIPKECDELEVHSYSGNIQMYSKVTANKINLIANGNLSLNRLTTKELIVNSAVGMIYIMSQLKADTIEINKGIGSININSANFKDLSIKAPCCKTFLSFSLKQDINMNICSREVKGKIRNCSEPDLKTSHHYKQCIVYPRTCGKYEASANISADLVTLIF